MSISNYIQRITEKYDPNAPSHPVDTINVIVAKNEDTLGWLLFNHPEIFAVYLTEYEDDYDEYLDKESEDSKYTIEQLQDEEFYFSLSESELNELYDYFIPIIDMDKIYDLVNNTQWDSPDGNTIVYFTDPEIISEPQWYFHFSNEWLSILSDGFIYGTDEPLYLGLTMGRSSGYEGYNFAFHIDDLPRYVYQSRYQGRGNMFKYGDWFVIFKVNRAVKAYHTGDEEEQCIFWGSEAYDMFTFTINNEDMDLLIEELADKMYYFVSTHGNSPDEYWRFDDMYFDNEKYEIEKAFKTYLKQNDYNIEKLLSAVEYEENVDKEYIHGNLEKIFHKVSIIEVLQPNKPSVHFISNYIDETSITTDLIEFMEEITTVYDKGKF